MNEILAYVALSHNSALIKKAEKIINEMAADENTIIYIKNLDGSSLRLHAGCSLIFCQSIGGKNDKI